MMAMMCFDSLTVLYTEIGEIDVENSLWRPHLWPDSGAEQEVQAMILSELP